MKRKPFDDIHDRTVLVHTLADALDLCGPGQAVDRSAIAAAVQGKLYDPYDLPILVSRINHRWLDYYVAARSLLQRKEMSSAATTAPSGRRSLSPPVARSSGSATDPPLSTTADRGQVLSAQESNAFNAAGPSRSPTSATPPSSLPTTRIANAASATVDTETGPSSMPDAAATAASIPSQPAAARASSAAKPRSTASSAPEASTQRASSLAHLHPDATAAGPVRNNNRAAQEADVGLGRLSRGIDVDVQQGPEANGFAEQHKRPTADQRTLAPETTYSAYIAVRISRFFYETAKVICTAVFSDSIRIVYRQVCVDRRRIE